MIQAYGACDECESGDRTAAAKVSTRVDGDQSNCPLNNRLSASVAVSGLKSDPPSPAAFSSHMANAAGVTDSVARWVRLAVSWFATFLSVTAKGARGARSKVSARRAKSHGQLEGADNGRGGRPSFTWEEVARHDTPDDCWIVIRGKVFDVTEFGKVHPGGSVIFTQGGRDASDVFSCFHAPSSWGRLHKLSIGDLKDDLKQEPGILADFRKLRYKLIEEGMFNSNKFFYAWKLGSNFSILTSSVALLLYSGNRWAQTLLSAFLLALFWQQSGWLAHDFLHHQVFKTRRWNNWSAYLIGNVCLGFSVDWWKSKHNKHHAAPNELNGDKHAVDPDIDTLPLLAWSSEMLETIPDSAYRAMIRFQHWIFFPILMMARLVWLQQSFFHAVNIGLQANLGWVEVFLIGLHYIWYFGVVFSCLSPMKIVAFLLVSQVLSGFMLGIAFVQSHNGMEIYSDSKDFVTSQVISTRDIVGTRWVNWFMGGLNYQIEHHLFPTLPRHNLKKVQTRVKELCARHGLSYEECTMAVGTKRVVQQLLDVARCA